MSSANPKTAIRRARPEDVPLLGPIESAGDALFADAGHPEFVGQPPITPEAARAAIASSDLWVIEMDGTVVGFVQMDWHGNERAVHQISVHPDAGQAGLGSALMRHVIDNARAAGEATIVLDTQTDVPWNRPWYERLGFRVVPEPDWTAAMRAVVARQKAEGLDWTTRVHMRLEL